MVLGKAVGQPMEQVHYIQHMELHFAYSMDNADGSTYDGFRMYNWEPIHTISYDNVGASVDIVKTYL